MAAQHALLKQVFADVNHREAEAKRMLEKDPKMALAMLQETRKKVEAAGLEPAAARPLAAAAGPIDRRHPALHRAEPLADRTEREKQCPSEGLTAMPP